SVAYAYDAFVGRFLLTPVALVAPLFASVLRVRFFGAAVAALAIVTLLPNLLFDHAKPSGVTAGPSIWTMTRTEAQSLALPPIAPLLDDLERDVPVDGRVGYSLSRDEWEYPLNGPRLTRRLVHLESRRAYADADADALRWIVVGENVAPWPPPPGWMRLV